jgi:hypothetical protein
MRRSIFGLRSLVYIIALCICIAGLPLPMEAQSSLKLEGTVCKRVFLAYGENVARRDAALYQEYFCKENGLETGFRQFFVPPRHKGEKRVEYLERNQYSSAGKLEKREAHVIAGGKTDESVYEYAYDSNGRLKTIAAKSTTGPIAVTRKYSYSNHGRLEMETYMRGGKIWTNTKFTYDALGRKLAEYTFSGKGDEEESAVFAYNDLNQLVNETRTRTTGQITVDIYSYDEGGRLVGKREIETSGQIRVFKTLYYDYIPKNSK